jgi:hypothetical protein
MQPETPETQAFFHFYDGRTENFSLAVNGFCRVVVPGQTGWQSICNSTADVVRCK